MQFASNSGPYGIQPASMQTRCVNKSGTTLKVGDVVVTSFLHTSVVTDPSQSNDPAYVFNTVRLADGDEANNHGYLGVVTRLQAEGGGPDKVVNVQFGGIANAFVTIVSGGTVPAGTPLVPTDSGGKFTNSGNDSSASMIGAVLLEEATSATTAARVFIPLQYWMAVTI